MHDPLSVADLVHDELWQRRESGYEVSAIEADLAREPTDDHGQLKAHYLELIRTRRRTDWHYQEPDLLEEIIAAMPAGNRERPAVVGRSHDELADRILGGWQGRTAGCTLGKPMQDGDFWTPDRIRAYLKLANAYPLCDYIPALEVMPKGFRLRECWPETTRGHVHAAARDDDLEAVERSLDYVPARSRLAEALGFVNELNRTSHTWEQALDAIRSRFGHYGWVHSINNACLITAGLLWGRGDFAATVGLTVQGGWDTDSNAATAGSVVGTVLGATRLPAHFINPLHDRTRSAVFGYDNSQISDLARRTTDLAEHGLRSDPGGNESSAA